MSKYFNFIFLILNQWLKIQVICKTITTNNWLDTQIKNLTMFNVNKTLTMYNSIFKFFDRKI